MASGRDVETPDLWEELWRRTELLTGASDENTSFTADERAEIVRRLNEFQENARATGSLSASQLVDLNSKVDYLVDASERLGRKDWLNACIGAVLGYFLTAAVPPDDARHIVMTLLNGIAALFGHGLPGLSA